MKKIIKNYMTLLPQTIGKDSDLKFARHLMEDNSCHHLPVLDGGKLVGVLSYFDLSLVQLTSNAKTSLVEDVMSTNPYIVEAESSVKDVATQMLEQKISSAIVSASATGPWGIFTSTDALKIVSEL